VTAPAQAASGLCFLIFSRLQYGILFVFASRHLSTENLMDRVFFCSGWLVGYLGAPSGLAMVVNVTGISRYVPGSIHLGSGALTIICGWTGMSCGR